MATIKYDLPLIPLRDVVIFPGVVSTLFVGRNKSINALNAAMAGEKKIILAAQKDGSVDAPSFDDLFKVATVANILQLIKLPDGTVKVLVEGAHRAQMESLESDKEFSKVRASLIIEPKIDQKDGENLTRFVKAKFHDFIKLTKKIAPEVLASIDALDDLSRVIDSIAGHLPMDIKLKQEILETPDFQLRAEILITFIESQLDVMDVDKKVRNRVKGQMEKSQREYYLNEQIKAAQKELGDINEEEDELTQLESDIEKAGMSKEALKKAKNEFAKFKQMSPMSAEASVVRSYLDWLTAVPWKKKSKVKSDLKTAINILDEDHFGLDEVKERILEYLAVQQRVKKLKAPVICLVGPPGVGKTSLGKSIARATNRKFARMSLGGVRDESEIRGHRRTYIGSMPGKIIQKLSKVETKNPLFLLDEIDKMGMDNRGDPASALLEVLDPEQNNTFSDHYLEVDFDLSEVMFVCTANSLNIPRPLLDRMEIISIPGYIEDEKLNIAKQYLIPKQLERNGLKENEVKLTDPSILDIVRHYTREAGVRGLERQIAKIFRKSVKERVLADEKRQDEIEKYLILGNKNKVQEIELEQKVENTRREKEDKKLAEEATKRFFELKLGGVIRPEFQQNLPINSTLNNTTSNLLGKASYNLSKYFKIGYDFSLDNDLSTLEYNSIDTTVELKKLIATFNYTEENGKRGNTNTIASSYTYNFNDSSKFSFKTRRNRKISLTEYYDFIYEYENDCLTAGLKYRKSYYEDRDLTPKEDLMFTITLFPLTTLDQVIDKNLYRDRNHDVIWK